MRVLIVGCGYVGLSLAATLLRQGHHVTGLRRPGTGEAALRQAGVEPVLADITDPASLSRCSPAYDWIVNCVSAGSGPDAYRAVYFHGTRNLLEWLAPSPVKKFVYTSSTGVYAQDDGSLVDEQSSATGAGETGAILAETEAILLAAARAHSFPAVVLRLSGIYGPGRGYWLKQFLAGEARLEPSPRWLNMIHRDDVVGAITAALLRGIPGTVYNVTDDEPVIQRDVFAWLGRELGRPSPPLSDETIPTPRRRGAANKRISNRRLREDLGYRLVYPTFREGYRAELSGLVAGSAQV